MCDQQSLRSDCAYAQSDQCICYSLEYFMIVKLLTEHHLEFLSLKGSCTGSSEPTRWKSHALANMIPKSNLFCSCCSLVYKLTNVLNNHYSIIGLRKWFLYQFKIQFYCTYPVQSNGKYKYQLAARCYMKVTLS